MHQATTARRVAEAIEQQPEGWTRIRVSLRSDDGSLSTTTDAIAAHLVAWLPGFDPASLDVVLAALPRWCATCGAETVHAGDLGACAVCGGPLLPVRGADPVAVDFLA